jgi:hypothetical protein
VVWSLCFLDIVVEVVALLTTPRCCRGGDYVIVALRCHHRLVVDGTGWLHIADGRWVLQMSGGRARLAVSMVAGWHVWSIDSRAVV